MAAIFGDSVKLTKVAKDKSKIIFSYEATGRVAEAFRRKSFTVDYSEDLSDIPESILAIVFVVNVLPVVWIYDAELIIPRLDSTFTDAVPEFKQGFIDMYPNAHFGGKLTVVSKEKCSYKVADDKALLFYSGGVDAVTSMISLIASGVSPALMTVWGADIRIGEYHSWNIRAQHTEKMAARFDLGKVFVKTDFREFLNEEELSAKVWPMLNDGWWHGLQHGIGLIGHAAPYAYMHGIKNVYIASSYTRGEIYTCASDPTIDNYVSFGRTHTIHHGYELSRQDKIHLICQFAENHNTELPLIVCWESEDGKNCGKCEKCMRTSAGFIAEGQIPSRFGISNFNAHYLKKFLQKYWISPVVVPGWKSIQRAIHVDNPLFLQDIYDIGWLKSVDLDHINDTANKKMSRATRQLRHFISKGKATRVLVRLFKKYTKPNNI